MPPISRGFRRRRPEPADAARIPPGQHLVGDFPVLSAGPTPRVPLDAWELSVEGAVGAPRRWSWEEFRALPSEHVTQDIHCVTSWSKLDTVWDGVSVDALLEGTEPAGGFVIADCYGGYTTNLPMADVTGGRAWIAHPYRGGAPPPPPRGPARPPRSPPLPLEEGQGGP